MLCSSMTAVPKTRSYITTMVVENDFIPRYMYISTLTCTVHVSVDMLHVLPAYMHAL